MEGAQPNRAVVSPALVRILADMVEAKLRADGQRPAEERPDARPRRRARKKGDAA